MTRGAEPRAWRCEPALELWLLRHGATDWARRGLHTGRTDVPLLPEGEAEARALAAVLAPIPFAAVLVSPLQRARRTAELAGLGGAAQLWPALEEWDYGDYEGITTAEIRRGCPDWTLWSHGCPGGETPEAIEERCAATLHHALELTARADGSRPIRVALVAHGHILRSLAGVWLGLGARGGALLALATGTLSVLGSEREQRAILRWNAPVNDQSP